MNPEDDPEARIRALEQPLADTARASELGGPQRGGYSQAGQQPYPPPAPPPPPPPPLPPPYGEYNSGFGAGGYNPGSGPGYGVPPLGATPRRSSGNRLFWILAAVFIVATLGLVGGFAAYVAHRISQGNVIVAPPSSSVFNPPRSIPGSPNPTRTRTPSAGPSTPSTAPAPGSNQSIAGIGQTKTVACNNSTVTVSGVSNTITISGHCTKVTVSGMQNSVTVDAADSIDASGLNNQVTYHSGSPQVNKSGDGNVVQQG
jgi:Protein of unknown function (DUF3060)